MNWILHCVGTDAHFSAWMDIGFPQCGHLMIDFPSSSCVKSCHSSTSRAFAIRRRYSMSKLLREMACEKLSLLIPSFSARSACVIPLSLHSSRILSSDFVAMVVSVDDGCKYSHF